MERGWSRRLDAGSRGDGGVRRAGCFRAVGRLRPTSAPLATPGLTSDVLTPFVTPAPSGEGLIECLRFDAWRLLTISR